MRISDIKHLDILREKRFKEIFSGRLRISVGMGTCGMGNGAEEVYKALEKEIRRKKSGILLGKVGCFGFCAGEPLVNVYLPGKPLIILHKVAPKDAAKIVEKALKGDIYREKVLCKIEEWDHITGKATYGRGFPGIPKWDEVPFFKGQKKIVLRDFGLIDPENIEDYIAIGGYHALYKAVTEMSPEKVIDELKVSKLRGRGGAGFPTWRKWDIMRNIKADRKYVVCNADEGDPGAYMNRNEIESDPHMLIEGMALGAYAMGANKGFVYCRAEYPLAVERLSKALADAKAAGFLGDNIMGSTFSFQLEIVKGAGAFVCGEETALIASAEGKAGRPMPRPPFPAQKGYKGFPTNINNVETWCNVPLIVSCGPEYFSAIGTEKSAGTKVFSLVGKVRNTGLVELPLGTSISDIVYGMGEGAGARKRIRAVQTGGPSGGCIPADEFSARVDYESLASMGAIMGSGGMVVMDQDNCMVDVARYFVSFTSAESCGKCTPCREGLSQMLRILTAITRGEAKLEDLDKLERLALAVKDTALCGLGQTAANPVLTTLKYFREEYEKHVVEKRCEAGMCEGLFEALCENSCPLHMNIPGYLALITDNRIEEAYELTLRDNPLPGVMGRICHFHCQMRCRRDDLDAPVAQGEIHRYLADAMHKMGRDKTVWARLVKEKKLATGRKIAIVGSGPAGLSASFYLARLGHEVTVYEAQPKAGGILRYGIPSYRLPKDILDKELELWKALGVKFVFNARVGKKPSIVELTSSNDAVILAVGAEEDKKLGIPGETLSGVHPGYEWLQEFASGKKQNLGKRSLVIGGGNVAIDAARTLFRLDKEVTVVYRRTKADMPANAVELSGAEEEGIRFEYMLQPEEILGNKGAVSAVRFRVMRPGAMDSSGRPKPVASDRIVDIPCDEVFVAVGESVDASPWAKTGVLARKDGRIIADPMSGKSAGTIWAVGDAVTGPATAAEAMGLGKRTARAIDRELMNRDAFSSLYRDFKYPMFVPLEPNKQHMGVSSQVPPKQRKGNFMEISLGYSGEQALIEAGRCLRCDVRANALSPWR
ncbi:MAG TPA: NADH-ubiquinone oxidoreductase-F iron-sulfur binding region domain-containing protein [Spirochaetales bacterium]|nr:NADH-ubiquinone oxidoreductase-F iron-sulfur binding region domain-containing protein [Spirochaetales bacterium]